MGGAGLFERHNGLEPVRSTTMFSAGSTDKLRGALYVWSLQRRDDLFMATAKRGTDKRRQSCDMLSRTIAQ